MRKDKLLAETTRKDLSATDKLAIFMQKLYTYVYTYVIYTYIAFL